MSTLPCVMPSASSSTKRCAPHVDELESGDMEPYPIVRKLFATFGIDEMARESSEQAAGPAACRRASKSGGGGGMFGEGGSGGMGFVLLAELCRVSMGLVTGMGVSLA